MVNPPKLSDEMLQKLLSEAHFPLSSHLLALQDDDSKSAHSEQISSTFTLDYSFAWDLAIHTEFDDPDLISRSQVCQHHKLQLVFLESCPL